MCSGRQYDGRPTGRASYEDSLEIGIVVDREQIDDPWPMLSALRAGLRELRDLAIVHPSDALLG